MVELSITPYASADNLPSTANENDIAVITEEEITNWCARGDTPVGTAEGSIWVVMKSSSAAWFNVGSASAPVILYPAAVMQYISGIWVYKDSYIFQNGSWHRIVYYLYNAGEEYTSVTGGWSIVNGAKATGVKNADNIFLGYTGSSGNRYSLAYTDVVNTESFSKLYVKYNFVSYASGSGNGFVIGLSDSNTATTVPNILTSGFFTSTGTHVSFLDISSIDEECYVTLRTNIANVNIYQVWLR